MRSSCVATALAVGILGVPLFAAEPLQSNYKVSEQVWPLLWEYRVTGPRAGQEGGLICTYFYQAVVVVYCRDINPPVIRLLKKIDEAMGKHNRRPVSSYRDRLGSYIVLVCDSKERERDLKLLRSESRSSTRSCPWWSSTTEGSSRPSWTRPRQLSS